MEPWGAAAAAARAANISSTVAEKRLVIIVIRNVCPSPFVCSRVKEPSNLDAASLMAAVASFSILLGPPRGFLPAAPPRVFFGAPEAVLAVFGAVFVMVCVAEGPRFCADSEPTPLK